VLVGSVLPVRVATKVDTFGSGGTLPEAGSANAKMLHINVFKTCTPPLL
jgi:hypothetical protein